MRYAIWLKTPFNLDIKLKWEVAFESGLRLRLKIERVFQEKGREEGDL